MRKLVLLVLFCAALPVMAQSVGRAQWKTGDSQVVVLNGMARFYHQGNQMMSVYPAVNFPGDPSKLATVSQSENQIQFNVPESTSSAVSQVQYQWQEKQLTVNIAFRPEQSKAVLVSIPGSLLAGKQVLMNGKMIDIPQRFEKHEFSHAKQLTFWTDQPDQQIHVKIDGVKFANLRDFRNQPNRDDFQIFINPKPGQTAQLQFTIGMTGKPKPQSDPKPQARADQHSANSIPPSEIHAPENPDWAKRDAMQMTAAPLPENWLINPGFEADFYGWGWGVTSYTIPDRSTRQWTLDQKVTHSGRQSLRYDVIPGQVPPMVCTMPIVTEPGKTYTVSAYVKPSAANMRVSLFLQTDTWGAFEGKRYLLTDGWQRITYSFKAPNSLVRLCLGDPWAVIHRKDQVAGSVWLDDVQFHEGDATLPFVQSPVLAWSDTNTRDQYIFEDDDQNSVNLHVTNTTGQARDGVQLDVRVCDVWGNEHLVKQYTCQMDASQQQTWKLSLADVPIKGILRLDMQVKSGDFQQNFAGRLGRINDLGDTDLGAFRYALRRDWLTPDEAIYLKKLGVRGSLSFFPPKNPSLIDQLASLDFMHITSIVNHSLPGISFKKAAMTDALWQTYSDELDKALPALAHQSIWKTINEPNTSGYPNSPGVCAQAVKIFYDKVKAINPNAVILSPDPYNASRDGQSWLDQFCKAGGAQAIDALSIHTYRARPEDPDLATDIQRLVQLKARHGFSDKPIYFTEGDGTCPYNLPQINASPLRGFFPWRMGPLSMDVGNAQRLAAAMMCRTLLACLAHRDDVAFYLDWGPDESPLHEPLSDLPTTQMCAINNLLNLVGTAHLHTEKLIGDQSRTYVFTKPDGSTVTAMWLYDLKVDRGELPGRTLSMPLLPEGWQLLDMMGNPVATQVEKQNLQATLGSHPIYLLTPQGTRDALLKFVDRVQIGGLGARSVSLQLRRDASGKGKVNVINRLPESLQGDLAVCVNQASWLKQNITLDPRQQSEMSIALPSLDPGQLSTANVEAVFTPSGNASPVSRTWAQQAMGIAFLPDTITIDGDPSDWSAVTPLHVDGAKQTWTWLKEPTWHGKQDLDAKLYLGWKSDGLYACVVVTDDDMDQQHDIVRSWMGDSLQLYVDLMGDGLDEPGTRYDSNDQVIAIALCNGKAQMYRTLPPEWQIGFVDAGPVTNGQCAVTRNNGKTVYEFHLPPKELFPVQFKPNTAFGFAMAVNDADRDHKRRQALVMTPMPNQPHALPEFWPTVILQSPTTSFYED